MQPEQLRAARALLNWSLDQVATASGVHRNTISNFETRKYDGDPEKLMVVRRALEAAGVIFIEENGQAAGARLRRFEKGDRVRFRPQTRVRQEHNIAADEIGTVVAVEPHPPRTGPTYMIGVKFGERPALPFIFRFEYELVEAAPVDDATAPFIIAIDPIGPIASSPYNTLDQALDHARGLERNGHKIRSINKGRRILEGVELRAALGEKAPSKFENFPRG